MTIVVTGGAGLIGSAFLATLNAAGVRDIIVVDNLASTDKWKNLSGKDFSDYLHKTEFINFLRANALPSSITGIIHLGACSTTVERNVDYLAENNYRYSRILADYSIRKNIRFIYASSASTYGNGELGYSDDPAKIPTLRPMHPYGYSKQLFDLWALKTGAANKICGLKFFNVFGPNEWHKGNQQSMVFKAYEQIQTTGKVKLFKSNVPQYANGEQKRDFVYVKDCCEVIYWLLEKPSVNGIFNVGTGKAQSWNELISAVFKALNKPVHIEYIDVPDSLKGQYQYFTQAEMQRLSSQGCPLPFRSLNDSVADYVLNHLEPNKIL